jgi:hypothetical protein
MLDELESKQRYSEYLREVQQEQLYQQIKSNQSNWRQGILMQLGDLLITIGHHLKDQKLFPNKSSTSLSLE